jgi:hypothetical protein
MKKPIYLALILLFWSACSKSESENQVNSNASANKLSFKMDGKLIECNKQIFCSAIQNNAIIQGKFNTNDDVGLSFILEGDNKPKFDKSGNLLGSLYLTINGTSYKYFEYWKTTEKCSATVTNVTNATGGGGIPVKLLTGTFEGVVKDDAGKKIVITEGKFTGTSVTGL